MSQPSETPKEALSALEALLKESPNPDEMQKRIIEQLMGGVTKEDARRIVYGKPNNANL